MKQVLIGAALAATMCASAHAQAPAPASPSGVDVAALRAVPKDAPPPKAATRGKYAVSVYSDPTLPTHTIYRPDPLSSVSGKLPILVWGNGACANNGRAFEAYLTTIASHGYLVIAIGPEVAPPRAPVPEGQIAPPASTTSQLIDAINWAVSMNTKPSPFQHRLDPTKIAAMGQSCGGLQATEAAATDPRVVTLGVWNSGTFAEGTSSIVPGATKASLARVHGSAIYVDGGPVDPASVNAAADFQKHTTLPVFHASYNVGHGGTYRQPNGGPFADVAVAWLDWRLKGDRKASRMFVGPRCTLCTDPLWKVEKKNIN